MSDWSDMLNEAATLKRRIDAQMSDGRRVRASSQVGTSTVNCRRFPRPATSDSVGNAGQRVDIYVDKDSTTELLRVGDLVEVDSIEHQIVSIRNICENDEVYNLECFKLPDSSEIG